MLRKLRQNKKGQNTAEYAILISLVVAGIIAMSTYAQRALQARVRDASIYLKNQTGTLGNSLQYEPYYLTQSYNTERADTETQILDNATTRQEVDSKRIREVGGFQESAYNSDNIGSDL